MSTGFIPVASGPKKDIENLCKAMGLCFTPGFVVHDGSRGISALYAVNSNQSNPQQFEDYYRDSMVYVADCFIDRYRLKKCENGKYRGYKKPHKLATISGKSVRDLIRSKNIDAIFAGDPPTREF